MMPSITIKRYADPAATGYAGHIEPEDKSWIAFVDIDGRPRVYLNRHAATGAVLPEDAATRAACIDVLDSEHPTKLGYFAGMRDGGDPLPGEPVATGWRPDGFESGSMALSL